MDTELLYEMETCDIAIEVAEVQIKRAGINIDYDVIVDCVSDYIFAVGGTRQEKLEKLHYLTEILIETERSLRE